MYDVIVVGAGFSGAVMAERCATIKNKKVLVIEQRDHIAGNCFDHVDRHNILVHKYGPHIFHTNKQEVWDYLSQFTEWHKYEHEVLANIDNKLVPVPFNLNSLRRLYSQDDANRLEAKLIAKYGYGYKVPIQTLRETFDDELKELAELIYEKVFVHYTSKQWGVKPEEISPEVIARVPVFISNDNRYFQDEYQAIPKNGYTKLFEKMLDHPNIDIILNQNAMEMISLDESLHEVLFQGKPFKGEVIFTGMIDELFGYKMGELEYRSLQFEFENYAEESFQTNATINYPNEHDYTRITEFKKITGQTSSATTIVKEFPQDYDRSDKNKNIPYYPMFNDENKTLYSSYNTLSNHFKSLIVIGRLGDFRYYNMDDAVKRSLDVFNSIFICDVY